MMLPDLEGKVSNIVLFSLDTLYNIIHLFRTECEHNRENEISFCKWRCKISAFYQILFIDKSDFQTTTYLYVTYLSNFKQFTSEKHLKTHFGNALEADHGFKRLGTMISKTPPHDMAGKSQIIIKTNFNETIGYKNRGVRVRVCTGRRDRYVCQCERYCKTTAVSMDINMNWVAGGTYAHTHTHTCPHR